MTSATADVSGDELPTWLVTTLIIVAVVIIVANAVVIIGIFKNRKLRRNVSNYFIASLAKDDLIAGLVVIPFGIIYEIESAAHTNGSYSVRSNSSWTSNSTADLDMSQDSVLSELFCDMFQVSITGQGYASTWHLCIIAMDRYYKITKPVLHKTWVTRKVICSVTILIDVVATAFAIYIQWLSVSFRTSSDGDSLFHGRKSCVYYKPTIQSMVPGYTVGLVPLMFMFYFYYKLFKLTRSIKSVNGQRTASGSAEGSGNEAGSGGQNKNIVTHPKSILKKPSNTSTTVTSSSNHKSSGTPATMSAVIVRYHPEVKQSKASMMIGFIIITYCACVFPPSIVYLLYNFCENCSTVVHTSPVIYIYPWLMFLNSAINPFIFALMTKEMRRFVTGNGHDAYGHFAYGSRCLRSRCLWSLCLRSRCLLFCLWVTLPTPLSP